MTTEQAINDISQQIRQHDHLYYVEGQPAISDKEYDELLVRLKSLEAVHPNLIMPDSPTQRVSGEPLKSFQHVTHAIPMLSIDNSYDEVDVRNFDSRVAKKTGKSQEYFVDPKVDGIAVSLRYEDGVLILGATRGNGHIGSDITANVKAIRSIPLKLHGKGWPSVLEVRGEVYWSRASFDAYNAGRVARGLKSFANSRNAAVGTLKSLDPSVVADRGLSFVAHGFGEIVGAEFKTTDVMFKAFKRWGIPVSPHGKVCRDIGKVIRYIKAWDENRHVVGYDTDGLVVKVNSLDQRNVLGATNRCPRWCIAYKYAAIQVTTILKDVDFRVAPSGTITPLAVMIPVQLAGVTIQHATLHNFDYVKRMDLRIGDTIIVNMAGGVIPKVIGAVTKMRLRDMKKITPPTHCPACDGKIARHNARAYCTECAKQGR